MADDPDKKRFFALMQRYNALGRLLPSEDDVTLEQEQRDTAKLILKEMAEVQAEMDAVMDKAAG